MIGLDIKGNFALQSDGEPSAEAEKLEVALREFLKFYRAESGEVLGYQVKVTGAEFESD